MPRRPTAASLLEQVLKDAYAHLDALEGWRGSLLDAPTLLSLSDARLPSPGGSRREGPVRLSLDLAGFSPEDVAVRLDGRRLKVTAKRETQKRATDGCCARDYREVYKEALLPDDADLEAVACALHADGQLRVEAPRLPPTTPPERVLIRIQREEEAVEQGKQVPSVGEAAGVRGDEKEAEREK